MRNNLSKGWSIILAPYLKDLNNLPDFEIVELKEKFGELRVVYSRITETPAIVTLGSAGELNRILKEVCAAACMYCGEQAVIFNTEGCIGPFCKGHIDEARRE